MAIRAAKITQSIEEKRYNTLNIIESSFMQGSEVDIFPVTGNEISELGAEKFSYDMDNPINTYVIFDERPKPTLLQRYGWYKENSDNVPILSYIPTHLLYKKEKIGNGELLLSEGEYIIPYNNVYDSTIVTNKNRLFRKNEAGDYEDISSTIPLLEGETIKNMVSSRAGVLVLTSNSRIFSWGTINDGGWASIFILRNLPIGEINNTPAEIDSLRYGQLGISSGDKVVNIYSLEAYTGAMAVMESGKLLVWGHNHQGKLFKPTASYYDYLSSVTNRTSYLNLMVGETITDIRFIGFVTIAITNKGRIIEANASSIVPITSWNASLGSGEYFEKLTGSYYGAYLYTNKKRFFFGRGNSVFTDINNYFSTILDDDEEVSVIKSPSLIDFSRRSNINYNASLYIITSKGRVYSTDIIFGTSTIIQQYNQPTLVTQIPLVDTPLEKVVDITFNKQDSISYIYLYTNLGRVLSYLVSDASTNSEELEVYSETVINETSLDGDEMLSIAKTGESELYKLKEISITRGAIIDIKYDFLTDRNMSGRLSRFYVADVKVDLVSLNYVANLVPYKHVEPDKGNENTDFKKINFSSDDAII